MTPSAMTPEQQRQWERFQDLIKDPVAGPQLMKILNQPNTTMGEIGRIGSMMSKAQTPSQQLGTGIGGAIGLGIQALRKKAGQQGQANTALKSQSQQVGDFLTGQNSANPSAGDVAFDPSEDMNMVESDRRGGMIGRKRKFAAGGEMEDAIPRKPPKREVLHRRPVISTTIVIAKKPPGREESRSAREEPEKKARGGSIQARKPAAVPPRRGPGNGDGPPSPYRKGGRVQVPRGSGVAQRGKRFSGIF
jgi:hypothetical protein